VGIFGIGCKGELADPLAMIRLAALAR